MKTQQQIFKKSFEENSENQANSSKSKNSKKHQQNSNSRLSTKESHILNMSNPGLNIANQNISTTNPTITNPEILELIESLREKISIYQQEIGNLLDEKVQMQITINKLQLSNGNNLLSNKDNNDSMTESKNQPVKSEFEKKIHKQDSVIKDELKILRNHIERQKEILEIDHSILNETVYEGQAIIHTSKRNFSERIIQKDITNLNLHRDIIVKDIKELKEELVSLIELQETVYNNLELNINNNDNKSENINKSIETVAHLNNQYSESVIAEQKQKAIPNIERYFVLNGKISLVDSENNLWHLTQCNKYEDAKKQADKNGEKFLNEFLECYHKISNQKLIDANKKEDESFDIDDKEINILKKHNKSQFDSVNHYNMTTVCTNRNSEKNYDSLVLDHEIKIENKNNDFNQSINESDLELHLDNNESLILSDSN